MQNWLTEVKRFLLILAVVVTLGFLSGQPLLALLTALAVYAVVNFYQLRRLYRWLSNYPAVNHEEPPESFGLWGDIFDGIYRLQRQERKASAYLESIIAKAQESSSVLEMAVVMIDKHNNLDWWNEASTTLLGLQYPNDKNQPVTNLIRDPRFAEYFYSEDYEQPLKLNAPGDASRILEFQIALFGEHERLMIVRDITQLHRLELMRKDFVGNVSHELGTPITVIKGYLEAIQDNMEDLDEKWRKPIVQMHQQSIRMENIVKDLLLLSSLETKTLPRNQEDNSVINLLNEISNDTRQIFAEKSQTISIDCEETLRIRGDRGELYSALSNLVVNAAKYTPREGEIEISVRETADSLDIAIQDNGIGIEEVHIPRLTERFYRVDVSRSSETGGTGLGLAIVKHILARHNSELTIESAIGKGSRFTCKFPLTRMSRVEPDTSAPEQLEEQEAQEETLP